MHYISGNHIRVVCYAQFVIYIVSAVIRLRRCNAITSCIQMLALYLCNALLSCVGKVFVLLTYKLHCHIYCYIIVTIRACIIVDNFNTHTVDIRFCYCLLFTYVTMLPERYYCMPIVNQGVKNIKDI